MSERAPSSALPQLVWVTPGTLNGASRREVARELHELGWQVMLLTSGPIGSRQIDGVETLCLRTPDVYLLRHAFFHLGVIRYVLRHWESIRVLLFHQMSVPWLLPLRLLHPFGNRRPLFVMDTRTVPMESKDKASLRDRLRGQFHWLMTRLGKQQSDGATAITERMAELLEIPAGRLWGTWPSGVNVDQFAAAQDGRRWPGMEDPVHIIYVGVLHYERNLMTLCKSVVMANGRGMKFKLSLVGDGTEKRDLQLYADQNPEDVEVLCAVPHEQIPGLLAKAHIGALPFPDETKYRVSSPIKLFEYMGAGMPILATRIACHTDVIRDGAYAFWAENAEIDGLFEALQRIWCRRESMPAMGRAAFEAAPDWSYAASAQRLSKALHHGISLFENR